MSSLRHQIYRAEQQIRDTDFRGWGDETERNVVRVFLKRQVEESLSKLVSNVIAGTVTMEEYENSLSDKTARTSGAG